MFLITELILFSPLIIYVCIRIRKLLSEPGLKNLFTLFYILLFLGYPIAESLSHREISSWARDPVIAAYCCLPYLLYFTLSAAALDIAVALAQRAKILQASTISSPGFRHFRIGCYFAIPALIVFAGLLNNNRLIVKEYSIKIPKKASIISELRIVFASDFHLGQLTDKSLLDRFTAKVNALNPDIVLIGGDVLEGHGEQNLAGFETQLRKLRAKYGVYAVPGNHESHGGGSNDFFAKSGMRLLEDRVEKIDNAFYLAGRKDVRGSIRIPIGDLLKAADDNLPVILLDHRPTDMENVSRSRADLQLSGHTHNGQLFPINLAVMPFQYELPWGFKVKRNTQFIVSSGLQAWGPPVKTAGDSEILFLKAKFQ
jgi:uncharacterized protein